MAVVSWLSNDNEVTKNKIRDDNIAPIELNALSASKTYTVGKPFVLDSDGKLYKATQQIDQGSAIITSGENANCEEVSDGAEGIFGTKQEIFNLNSAVGNLAASVGRAEGNIQTLAENKANTSDLGTASTKNSTSVVTESSDLVESGAVKDIVGWGNKNLLNPDVIKNTPLQYVPVYVGDGDYTLSSTCPQTGGNLACIFLLAGSVKTGASTSDNGVWNGQTRTVTAVGGYLTVASRNEDGVNPTLYHNQLEKGSTATAYEPYHASVDQSLRNAEVIKGKNLIGWKIGYVYSSTDGSLSPNTHGVCSDKIRVTAGQKFIGSKKNTLGSNDSMYARTYDANGDFVGTITVLTTTQLRNEITIPANIGYIGVFQLRNSADVSREWLDSNEIMFYDATETDPTFEPYYIPLKDVVPQKCDNSVIGTVEDGSTASQDYAVGDYFIKNTILGKTKIAIARGGTFTKDMNYKETDVAKEITELYKYIGILTTPISAVVANNLQPRFKDITSDFYLGTLRAEIAAGDFSNIRVGDYIIGQTTGSKYYVACLDWMFNKGDQTNATYQAQAYGQHHLGLMLFKPVGTTSLWLGKGDAGGSWQVSANDKGRCPWNAATDVDPTSTSAVGSNDTNITRSYNGSNVSGYMGSFIRERMDAILLPQCFQADFGSSNVLMFRNLNGNAVITDKPSGGQGNWNGCTSGWDWYDRYLDLPSEVEIYGSRIFGSAYDIGVQCERLPMFKNADINAYFPRLDLWTKAVASSFNAARRSGDGIAGGSSASVASWACPLACVR